MTSINSIRKYAPSDRNRIFEIGADTAFFGDPIEAYLEDRFIFLDAFYAYYTDLEPSGSWVACSGEKVVGFLTGCLNTKRYQQDLLLVIAPKVLKKLFLGKYKIGKRSLSYFLGLSHELFPANKYKINYFTYPAHFHINVGKKSRGNGLGSELIACFLSQLENARVPGVYLLTTSENKIACKLYEKMGFNLLWSKSDHFWTHFLGREVLGLCYGRIIN